MITQQGQLFIQTKSILMFLLTKKIYATNDGVERGEQLLEFQGEL